mgnify:CR=1 FL=1
MNNILIALLIGVVAGIIDVVPMIFFSVILGAGIGIAGASFIG